MAVPNKVLLCQIIGYLIGLVLSFYIIAPMSYNLYKFNSHCLLFSYGKWLNEYILDVTWSPCGYCGFVIFVGALMLTVCSIQLYRVSMLMYHDTDSSFLSAFLEAVGCMLMSCLTMYAAVTVTFGFMTWCENMLKRYPTCEDADGEKIKIKNNYTISDIDTKGFYSDINAVMIVMWASFSIWVGLAVCSTVKVCYYHHLSNMPPSIRGERQPLLNENGNRPPVTLRQ